MANGLTYHQDHGRGLLPAGLIEEINALAHPPIRWESSWRAGSITISHRSNAFALTLIPVAGRIRRRTFPGHDMFHCPMTANCGRLVLFWTRRVRWTGVCWERRWARSQVMRSRTTFLLFAWFFAMRPPMTKGTLRREPSEDVLRYAVAAERCSSRVSISSSKLKIFRRTGRSWLSPTPGATR